MAWRQTETHAVGQLCQRLTTILLQLRKNLPVNTVHQEKPPNLVSFCRQLRKIIPLRFHYPSITVFQGRASLWIDGKGGFDRGYFSGYGVLGRIIFVCYHAW